MSIGPIRATIVDMTDTLTQVIGAVLPLANAWHDGDPGWWVVFFPLFWLLVIGGAFLLLRNSGRWGGPRGPARETAIEVLERRYAEGELSAEEYHERRSVLNEERR